MCSTSLANPCVGEVSTQGMVMCSLWVVRDSQVPTALLQSISSHAVAPDWCRFPWSCEACIGEETSSPDSEDAQRQGQSCACSVAFRLKSLPRDARMRPHGCEACPKTSSMRRPVARHHRFRWDMCTGHREHGNALDRHGKWMLAGACYIHCWTPRMQWRRAWHRYPPGQDVGTRRDERTYLFEILFPWRRA